MKIYKRIALFATNLITGLLLAFAFVLGIGIVGLLFKATGRRLLRQEDRGTTWESLSGSGNAARMY